jgi:hypothetical protein
MGYALICVRIHSFIHSVQVSCQVFIGHSLVHPQPSCDIFQLLYERQQQRLEHLLMLPLTIYSAAITIILLVKNCLLWLPLYLNQHSLVPFLHA